MTDKPRQDRLSWNDYHMLSALVISQRSPDPSTQVGCVIVSPNNRPIASGYNGPPRGISPELMPWGRSNENPAKTKYPYVVHAETNAIHNATTSTKGAILYTTLFPCCECTKNIIQAGIREVVYLSNKYKDEWTTQVADWMLSHVDIPTRQHKWDITKALLCLQNLSKIINQQQ